MIVSTHSYRDYLFTISHDPSEPGYTVDFPDIAEIVTSHGTLPGAFANTCSEPSPWSLVPCPLSLVPGS